MALIRGISARAKRNEKNWQNRERSVPEAEPMGTGGLPKLCFLWKDVSMIRWERGVNLQEDGGMRTC